MKMNQYQLNDSLAKNCIEGNLSKVKALAIIIRRQDLGLNL